ncbi:kinase-like domain-containing protein [Circinella umbellata]|nr:kinase-like domain-containing protein [Circinella umbellata]
MTIKSITQSFKRGIHRRSSVVMKKDSSTKTATTMSTNNNPKKSGALSSQQQRKSSSADHKNSNNNNNTTATSSNNSSTVSAVGNQDASLHGIGPYKFIGPLGSGKFSRVMLAKHLETDKQVAIKIIDKQAHDYRVMSRLVREINLMEMLKHDNIVKLFETYETCDSLFLIMEYIPGMNLDEYLHKNGGHLTEDQARLFFRQIVSAVYFCHNRWVVHRDLKTPNILVTPNGVIKLADFGLGNRFGLQRLKTICGSMLYYSPEIITGQKYFGPEVDCWCLGIALFRMTAGFEPFSHAHTVGELKKDVCSCNFPMPSHLSPELQTTILKCLQTDRRKRMTVRQALKDDPWLTKFGELPCPFSNVPKTAYDEIVGGDDMANSDSADREERERRARRQFMQDLERDRNLTSQVKHTIIYHPINPSTYFTTHLRSTQQQQAAGNNNDTNGSTNVNNTISSTKSSSSANSSTSQHNHHHHRHNHHHHRHNHHHHHHHKLHQQHHYHYRHENIEVLRSELLQSIRSRTRKIGMRSAESLSIRSPVQALTIRLKPNMKQMHHDDDEKPTPNSASFRFSQVMQRLTKDQVYYYHLDRPTSHPPSLSSSSSTSVSSLSTVESPTTPEPSNTTHLHVQPPIHPSTSITTSTNTSKNNKQHQQQRAVTSTERDVMTLLKLTCQLMGITYQQESNSHLTCVLTLRDASKINNQNEPPRQHQEQGPPSSSNNHKGGVSRRNSGNSTASSTKTTTTTTGRMSSNGEDLVLGAEHQSTSPNRLRRLSLPLLSHLTSSMTTSFFGRTKQRHSMDQEQRRLSVINNDTVTNPSSSDTMVTARNKKKDGVAIFTIDVTISKRQLVAIRFSKQQGSTTVFKMAGGWITGVMGLGVSNSRSNNNQSS